MFSRLLAEFVHDFSIFVFQIEQCVVIDFIALKLLESFGAFMSQTCAVEEKRRELEMRTLQLQGDAQLPEGVEALLGEELDQQVAPGHRVGLVLEPGLLLGRDDPLLGQLGQDGSAVDLSGQTHFVPLQQAGNAPGAGHIFCLSHNTTRMING